MGKVFTLSLTAALNPTLLAAVTLMLSLLSPKRLLSGYLGGALVTSITCGLLLVFVLNGSSTSSTTKHTVSPILNFVLGAIILFVAFVVDPYKAVGPLAHDLQGGSGARHPDATPQEQSILQDDAGFWY